MEIKKLANEILKKADSEESIQDMLVRKEFSEVKKYFKEVTERFQDAEKYIKDKPETYESDEVKKEVGVISKKVRELKSLLENMIGN